MTHVPAFRRVLTAPVWIVATLALAGCATTPPRDYYFSPAGNDRAGAGTLERPWQSVARANQLDLNPGDRLLFEGGQAFAGNLRLGPEDAGRPGQPIYVGSYGRGRATIRAGDGSAVRVTNAGGVRVGDLLLLGSGARNNHGSGVEFVNDRWWRAHFDSVTIENVEAAGFGQDGILVRGCPTDRGPSGYRRVRISDCVAHDNTHTGIYVTGYCDSRTGAYANSDVTIVSCRAFDNRGDPARSAQNRSGSGIFIEAVDGARIEHCLAYGNGALCRAARGGPVGIWATACNGVLIQSCESHHNRTGGPHDGGGFCLDGGVTHSVMRDNLSHDNDGSGFGIFCYAAAPPTAHNVIRNNTSINDGRQNSYAGIHLWNGGGGVRDVLIQDNRIIVTPAPGGTPRGIWLQSPVADVLISGNLLTTTPGAVSLDVAPGQRAVTFQANEQRRGPVGPRDDGSG